jgi:HEAT repeat protein
MLDRRLARSFVAAAAAVAACLGPPAAASVVHAGTWPRTVRVAAAGDQGGRSTPYRDGQKALDDKDWKAAARAFRGVAGEKGSEADAALYWLAYALHHDGDEAGALAALRDLRASYPRSGWIDDSRALELEMRGPQAGAAAAADAEDEELKLLALNGLMHADAGRAMPILRRFLEGDSSPRLKKQALFVLGQSGAPEARQLLVEVARGRAHPGMQREAIAMLGIAGRGSAGALSEIYRESTDREVKSAVLDAFLVSGAQAEVLAIAKGERDPALRREAVAKLGPMGARQQLRDFYAAEPSADLRRVALEAMGVAGDAEGLAQVARSERDPALRRTAIHSMGITGGGQAGAVLKQIYLESADDATREAVVQALFVQSTANVLVELFRAERDPRRRRDIVQKLTLMSSPEATDLLMELLDGGGGML